MSAPSSSGTSSSGPPVNGPPVNGVLKAGTVAVSGERRSTLRDPAPAPASPAVAAPDPQALRIAELEQALAAAQAQSASQAKAAETREQQAFERGRAQGAQAGQAAAQQRYDERVQALTEAVTGAQQRFETQLAEVARDWSLQLAQAALARIVGDGSLRAELVARTLAHHLSALSQDSVLAVEVSGQDFPDADFPDQPALRAALSRHGALPPCRIDADPARAAGSCVVRLKLGRLDLGLASQRERLDAAFARLREGD
ncbi:hypothetical protein [Lysobacter enzymogenes]|uniref:FliH/SctL family protein n=1 Tax=Lysobacter enzymogenes TaxID=69 RepID=UPI000F4B514A|nr:hypothetical protein [Lysobacter enzymogenes]